MSRKSTLLVALMLLLCGCGAATHQVGASQRAQPSPVAVVRPSRPVWCPTTRSTLRQSVPNSGAAHSFDTRTLLGQPEAQAAATVERFHCSWRVVERDGRRFALTADISLDRVDVTITHGRVTAVGVY